MKHEFVLCDCYGHSLLLLSDEEDKQLYLTMFQYGYNSKSYSWKTKLRHIWTIIKYGHPYTDEIILSKEELKKTVDFLNQANIEFNG